VPQGKLELLARGLSHVQRYDGGLLTVTHLTTEDYRLTNSDESFSEGVVDHLRSVEGTAMAGLVRDVLADELPRRKVSLRATDDRVDVSVIARSQGGGGHRRAAGFSTDLDFPELVEILRAELARQL
jgi:phosphoesterase RecJ-like protein